MEQLLQKKILSGACIGLLLGVLMLTPRYIGVKAGAENNSDSYYDS